MLNAVGQPARKRLAVRQQFVEHRADRKDVAAMVDGLPVICSGDM